MVFVTKSWWCLCLYVYVYVYSYYVILHGSFSPCIFLASWQHFLFSLCNFVDDYTFCTFNVGRLSLRVVGYSVEFSCVFDSLFSVSIVITSLLCVMSVGAGDGVSCLCILAMFVVGLALKCSFVLWYTLPQTFIRYVLGCLIYWGCSLHPICCVWALPFLLCLLPKGLDCSYCSFCYSVWWWYVMFELWLSLLNISLIYCEPQFSHDGCR